MQPIYAKNNLFLYYTKFSLFCQVVNDISFHFSPHFHLSHIRKEKIFRLFSFFDKMHLHLGKKNDTITTVAGVFLSCKQIFLE